MHPIDYALVALYLALLLWLGFKKSLAHYWQKLALLYHQSPLHARANTVFILAGVV